MSDQADERDQTTNTTLPGQDDHGQPGGRSGATAVRPGAADSDRERVDPHDRTERATNRQRVERDRDEGRDDDRSDDNRSADSDDRPDGDPLQTQERRDPEVRETASGEDVEEDATTDGQPVQDPQQQRHEEAERREAAQEFAAEHDPAEHDISAGEDFRQRGDWTAQKAGEPQVWDSEGNLVEGSERAGTLGTGDVDSQGALGAGHGSDPSDDDASDGDASPDDGASSDGRRVSSPEEVVDGGYSVGSAAPIGDGAMPLGHPVKAWHDTATFLTPGSPGYEGADPHVWFTDARAAEAAGFHPAD